MQPDADAPEGTDRSCPHCGAGVAPPGRFCTACGRPVDAGEDQTVTEPDPARGGAHDPPAAGGGQPSHPQHRTGADAPPPPASGRGASRRCSSCGTVNPRTRELCRACGLDLDPDDRTSVPPRPPVARPRPARRFRALRRWWVPVAAALVAVPLVVGVVLYAAGLGPFAPPDEGPLEPVAFPEDRYAARGAPLALSDVATLTTAAADGERRFGPEALVDGDPTTTWRSDPDGLPADVPETIDLFLERPAWITAIAISNGDHHDLDAYRRAGRIETAELVFDGELRVRARLEDLGRQRQLLTLEEPLLSTAVRLELIEIIAGTDLPGAAVSSIEVRGHVADDEDVPLAEERADRRPATGSVVVTEPAELPARLRLPGPTQGS